MLQGRLPDKFAPDRQIKLLITISDVLQAKKKILIADVMTNIIEYCRISLYV